jgi:hypothetical protein
MSGEPVKMAIYVVVHRTNGAELLINISQIAWAETSAAGDGTMLKFVGGSGAGDLVMISETLQQFQKLVSPNA